MVGFWEEACPLPKRLRGPGSVVRSPGVRSGAPAANDFGRFWGLKNTLVALLTPHFGNLLKVIICVSSLNCTTVQGWPNNMPFRRLVLTIAIRSSVTIPINSIVFSSYSTQLLVTSCLPLLKHLNFITFLPFSNLSCGPQTCPVNQSPLFTCDKACLHRQTIDYCYQANQLNKFTL